MLRAFAGGFALGLLLALSFNVRAEVALQRGLFCGVLLGGAGFFIGALNPPANGAEERDNAKPGEPERR